MNIVAVGAHPDDVEVAGGGALLRLADESRHAITVVVVSDGSRGQAQITPDPALVTRREAEARAAGALLGADVEWLGFPDGEIFDSNRLRQALVAIMRSRRADLVLGPPPDDYNPDHLAVSKAVFAATLWSASPGFEGSSPLAQVPQLLYFEAIAGTGATPDVLVDISDTFERKLDLLRCHESQLSLTERVLGTDLVDIAARQNAFRGLQAGVAHAEGFHHARAWPRNRPIPSLSALRGLIGTAGQEPE